MDKIVARPKNEDIGKPLRDQRVPVMMTIAEYNKIDAAARSEGLGISTYMRVKAIKAADDV